MNRSSTVGLGWRRVALGVAGLWIGGAAYAQVETDWAYHAAAGKVEERVSERVPGREDCFVGGCRQPVYADEPVVLHVLTAQNFARDFEEQIWVRWWDGQREHWVQGEWVATLRMGGEEDAADSPSTAGSFRGQPVTGTRAVDLWRVVMTPDKTAPGTNYYSIQLKGTSRWVDFEMFLVGVPVGDDGPINNLGQAWVGDLESTYGRDWSLEVVDR